MSYKYDKIWYNNLKKPKLQPPHYIFAPIWSILYILMFIALAIILINNLFSLQYLAIILFTAQLFLNLSWGTVFFMQKDIKSAFYICISLTILVALTTIVFYMLNPLAGYLFIPYLLWCMFATYLNWKILILNKD